jgi:hypothetical protein
LKAEKLLTKKNVEENETVWEATLRKGRERKKDKKKAKKTETQIEDEDTDDAKPKKTKKKGKPTEEDKKKKAELELLLVGEATQDIHKNKPADAKKKYSNSNARH